MPTTRWCGCGPRGRRNQGIGAEDVPWEIWGNVVLPQGRSRDASSGLSPEVGGGWDRGRNQHEIPGPDPRQSLDLQRSLRAPSTIGRSAANALARLLPRLGGPDVGVRWLYAGVVRSRLLYGAPIWAEDLMASRRSLLEVRRLHWTVAIRVVRGFCTISAAAAAAVLAGFPPFELQALRCREIYLHTRGPSDGVDPVGADAEGWARRTLLDSVLPPLRCERGFGAAHVGVPSGVSAAAPRSHRGNRVGPLATGDPRGTVGGREREESRDLLLWEGYASEGSSGESKGAELPPWGDRPAGAQQIPRARLDKALHGRRSPRWGSKLGADRSAPRDRLARRFRRRCILCAGGARCVARTGSRASFDRSRVGHCGGFSRLESGTITPLPPPPRSDLVSVRISST